MQLLIDLSFYMISVLSMPRMTPQYLTAKIKLRPSRRKAAVLERARSAVEEAFWHRMEILRPAADQLLVIEKKKDRVAELKRMTLPASLKSYGLPSSLRDGLASDLERSISSYVELKLGDFGPEWPSRQRPYASRLEDGLDDLARSASKEEENLARNEIYRGGQPERFRPFILTRGRECRLLRKEENGSLVLVLEIVSANDPRSQKAFISDGIDACTGEVMAAKASKTRLLMPVSLSKWHENKFLSGKSILRSCIISRDGGDWYMNAQFEMATPAEITPEGVLGIDRGITMTAAGAIVGMNGHVKDLVATAGSEVSARVRRYERLNRKHQRRKGVPRKGHRQAVDQILHELANDVVALAKEGRLAVAMEKLDGFKLVITTKRARGTRRSGWQKHLKKMQLAKLEDILAYKLRLAGLPPLQQVVAPGTSQTCSACGYRDRSNRPSQAEFKCSSCGSEFHADLNAGVQIARRGVIGIRKLNKKGSKMDALHKNMVDDLSDRDDAGLGPLSVSAGEGFVAVLDSARSANDRTQSGLRPGGSKNSARNRQKTGPVPVFSESGDSIFVNSGRQLLHIRCGVP